MKLQAKILYCRKKAGLSQEALAELIGVSRQAVSKWETGDATPEVNKLSLLANAFGVTADWLISEDEPEKETEPEPQAQAPDMAWLDSIPGRLGRLLRRFGWLFGVYVAIVGAGFALIGGLSRTLVRKMFSGPLTGFGTDPFSTGNAAWYDEAGNAISGSFGSQFSLMSTDNPVYIMGTAVMVLGIVLIIAGIVSAIFLKKRFGKK